MNCKKASRLLSPYQDRELTPDLEQEVELHLRDCRSCRTEWDGLQELVGRLKNMPAPASAPCLPVRVMVGLQANRTGKFRLLPAAAYALVFLTIFLSGFFLQVSSDKAAATATPQAATFSAVLLENQDLGLLGVHDNTLGLFER